MDCGQWEVAYSIQAGLDLRKAVPSYIWSFLFAPSELTASASRSHDEKAEKLHNLPSVMHSVFEVNHNRD